jgi:hypothetical protein
VATNEVADDVYSAHLVDDAVERGPGLLVGRQVGLDVPGDTATLRRQRDGLFARLRGARQEVDLCSFLREEQGRSPAHVGS